MIVKVSSLKTGALAELCQDVQTNLLEANVHVKGQRLSWVADRRDAELSVGGGDAGGHLHRVGSRVISHLQNTSHREHVSAWC